MMSRLAGFLAAVAAVISFGSFAVPIKSRRVVDAKVHPVIFQTYKSFTCFAVSWAILFWAEFRFTWYGVLAAAIWVQTGVMAIVAIHLAGLGVAQAIWSGSSIAVSFALGKLLFHEPMSNAPLAVTGMLLMLAGMGGIGVVAGRYGVSADKEMAQREAQADMIAMAKDRSEADLHDDVQHIAVAKPGKQSGIISVSETQTLVPQQRLEVESQPLPSSSSWWQDQQYGMGVVVATWVGISAGSMMICLKLAPDDCKGDQYALSFGLGVGMVILVVDVLLFAGYHVFGRKPPSFHFVVACGPASLAGLLWSVGNYLSVIAVDQLGIAVGYPIVQCNLVISSMWALFYYNEIQGSQAVIWFMISTVIVLAGVTLLAVYGL